VGCLKLHDRESTKKNKKRHCTEISKHFVGKKAQLTQGPGVRVKKRINAKFKGRKWQHKRIENKRLRMESLGTNENPS